MSFFDRLKQLVTASIPEKSQEEELQDFTVELDRKAVIYSDLEGLERGEAIKLLNEIVLEQLAQDPNLSLEIVKKATPGFQNAMLNLSWENIAFLCASAIDYYIRTSVFDQKKK